MQYMQALRFKPSAHWRLDDPAPFQDYSGYSRSATLSGTSANGISLSSDTQYSQVFNRSGVAAFDSPVYVAGREESAFSMAATVYPISKSEGETSMPYRENLALNPTVSENINGWGRQNGGSVISRNTTETYRSSSSVQVDTTGSIGAFVVSKTVKAGTTVTASIWAKGPAGNTGFIHGRIMNSSATWIAELYGSKNFTFTGSWQRLSTTFTYNDAEYIPGLQVNTNGTTPLTYYIANPLVEVGTTLGSYFDGTMPGYKWSGEPNNSSSITDPAVSRVNYALNPVGRSPNNYEYGNRYSWAQSWITGVNDSPIGESEYYRATSPASTGSVVSGRGIDMYGNLDVAPGNSGFWNAQPVTEGEVLYVSCYSRVSVTTRMYYEIRYHDGKGNWVTPKSGTVSYTDAPANQWIRPSFSHIVPAGARFVTITLRLGNMDWPTGTTLDMTGLMIEKSPSNGIFFSGSSNGAVWTGDQNLSPSTMLISNSEQQILSSKDRFDGLSINGTEISFSTKYLNSGEAKCSYDIGEIRKVNLVGIHTKNKNSLYVDGVLVDEVDIAPEQQADKYDSPDNKLYSGYTVSSQNILANEYSLYPRALHPSEIEALHRAINDVAQGSIPKMFGGRDVPVSSLVRSAYLDTGWSTDEDWLSATLVNTVVDGDRLMAAMENGVTVEGYWIDSVDLYNGSTPDLINSINIDWSGTNETVEASIDGINWSAVKKRENLSIIPTGFNPTDKALYIRVSFSAESDEGFVDNMRVRGYLSNKAESNGRVVTYTNPVSTLNEFAPSQLRDDWGIKVPEGGSLTISATPSESLPVTNLFTNPSAEVNLDGIGQNRVVVSRTNEWAASGEYSFRLTRTADTATDAFMDMIPQVSTSNNNAGKLKPNTKYTIMGTYRLNTLIPGLAEGYTGENLGQRLSIFVHLNGVGLGSVVGTNTIGTNTLRMKFTTPASFAGDNTIRFYNGGAPGDVLEWDDLLLVEGDYDGPYFDGSTTDMGNEYSWSGVAHSSTSTRTPLTYEPSSTIEVWAKKLRPGSFITNIDVNRYYINGNLGAAGVGQGEWFVVHYVLNKPLTNYLYLGGGMQIGKVAMYDRELSNTEVSEIVAAYTGKIKSRYDASAPVNISEPSASTKIYAHDWEILSA